MNSDALGRIEDDELRSTLGAWPSLVEDATEGTIWLREHRDDVLVPLINEYVTMVDLRGTGESPVFEARPMDLFRDRRFAGALYYRYQVASTTIRELRRLEVAARRIVDLIEYPAGSP